MEDLIMPCGLHRQKLTLLVGTLCSIKRTGYHFVISYRFIGLPALGETSLHLPELRTNRARLISAKPKYFDVRRYGLGDKLSIEAFCNMSLHAPMMGENGTCETTMGVCLVFIE
jgi:hypothetical protein